VKTANATKSAVKAANSTGKAKANATDFIDPKPFPNPTPVPLAKANKGDTPEKKEPDAAPEALAKAKKPFIHDEKMEKTLNLVSQLSKASAVQKSNAHAQISIEAQLSAAYDKVYSNNANSSAKANSTDFIDPKPFPNPTPVPLAKANKGDTPEKKEPEAAPEAMVQKKANVSTSGTSKANVTQAAVKK
jgi:hypothetical protein